MFEIKVYPCRVLLRLTSSHFFNANKFNILIVSGQVRTRRFPSEVDTQATFIEISERLRDPEWEVRQHALRVLMDVLPTLNIDVVDKVMQPVVPELINNLGHPAPAVRKGALDTLRVYLVHSPNRENMVKNVNVRNALKKNFFAL